MSPLKTSAILLLALFLSPTASFAGAPAPSDELEKTHSEAVRLYEAGEYRRALEKFEAALKLAPREKTIRVNLGRSCVALASQIMESTTGDDPRELEHAAQLLQRALLHWEGDAQTHELIALCALRRRRLPEAERALATALERDASSGRTWNLLGVVRDQQGKIGPAIEALEEAYRRAPSDAAIEKRLRRLKHDRTTIAEGRPLMSARFRVFVPPEISVTEGRKVLDLLEETAATLERRWGGETPSGVEVILYPPGEFSRRTGLSEEVGGAFDGRIRVAFPTELTAGGLTLDQVIRHETAHLYLHRFSTSIPRWLDEGLAQLVDGGDRTQWATRFLEGGGSAPELGLRQRERGVGIRGGAEWAGLYLHSYLFLKHLEEVHGRFRLDLAVRRIARGTPPEKAFEEVYGKGPILLDRAWRASLREPSSAGGEKAEDAGGVQKPGGQSR